MKGKLPPVGEWSEADMCHLFPMIKNRLGQLGLFKAMHKFNDAENQIGYEVIEKEEARKDVRSG